MKTTNKLFMAGIAGMALLFGLVVAGCANGEFEGNGYDGDTTRVCLLNLEAGSYTFTVGGILEDRGIYSEKDSVIEFKSAMGKGTFKGLHNGNKVALYNVVLTKTKSVDAGDEFIYDGAVFDVVE